MQSDLAQPMTAPSGVLAASPGRSALSWLYPWLLAAIVFASIAPTLGWLEFSSSMENLNVTTAIEIRRTGNWLVPTLQGETRLQKPPLTAWMTAAVISDAMMAKISSPNFAIRDQGFRDIAVAVRMVALAAACLTLVVTFYIGRLVSAGDEAVGLVSLLVMTTSLLFLRFSRYATTDVQLSLWVAITNLLLLAGVYQRRWWPACTIGAVTLALGMMVKGPVAIVQTLVPVAILLAFTRPRTFPSAAAGILGLLIFLATGLAWYGVALFSRDDAVRIWVREVTGYGIIAPHTSQKTTYLLILPYMAPWFIFFLVGLFAAIVRRSRTDLAMLLLLIVPIIIMSFFRDRFERYLQPMLPAASILTAMVIVEHLRRTRWNGLDRIINVVHWGTIAAIGIGFPIAASGLAPQIHTVDGRPWFSPVVGWSSAALAAVLILIGVAIQSRFRWTIVMVPAAVMLGLHGLFIAGYARSNEGLGEYRPIAEAIWTAAPDAEVYNAHPRAKRPPPEIGIYLNRVIQWIDDPSKLQPGAVPKVLLIPQDKTDPEPSLPQQWQLLEKCGAPSDRWWCFILPAAKP